MANSPSCSALLGISSLKLCLGVFFFYILVFFSLGFNRMHTWAEKSYLYAHGIAVGMQMSLCVDVYVRGDIDDNHLIYIFNGK